MADKPKHIGMIAHIDAGKTTLTAAISRIVAQPALPPVDGLEVVGYVKPEYPETVEPVFVRELSQPWMEGIFTIPVVSLSQASSVIAGLRSERITAERDALDAYGKLQAAEARISSLEEEIKRLREALRSAGRSFNNIRGAIESNQVVDKDVHGVAVSARDAARQALEQTNG